MRRAARDLRFALRHLIRRPTFGAIAAGTLALGIGAAVATFSIVDTVLLRALPFDAPERLVAIWGTRPTRGSDRLNASPADFMAWRERSRTLESLAAFTVTTRELTGLDEPARVDAVRITRGFFATLGLRPLLGRPFRPEEHEAGNHRVAIVGHSFWRSRLGESPDAVGRRVQIDGVSYEIVGVMPPGEFDLLALRGGGSRAGEISLWTPLAFDAPGAGNTIGHWLTALGRLGEDVALEQAQTEMSAIATGLEAERPDTNEDWSVRLQPLREAVVGDVRPALALLSAAVALVLLIACTNVANLLLMRGHRRMPELAIRTSLGAHRRDIARQLLAESALVAIAAGCAGTLLAAWGLELLRSFGVTGFLPRGHVGIDGPALLFALVISLVTGLTASLAPIYRLSSPDVIGSLRERDGGWGRLRGRALAAAQVALSLVLVVSAGLLVRSLAQLNAVDPGFRSDVVVLDLTLSPTRYSEPAARDFFRRALEEAEAVPGVTAAGAISRLPLDAEGWCGTFVPLGPAPTDPGDAPCAEYRSIRGDYFRVMGIPILRGRPLDDRDDGNGPRTMVISRTMARRYWPDGEALGERIVWGDTFRVVGIAGDVRHFGLERPPTAHFYVHQLQDPNDDEVRDPSLVVQASGTLESIAGPLRAAIRALDADLPIQDVRSLEDIRRDSVAGPRVRTAVLTGFALIALLLSILGTYAVLGYYVAGRMREMAIRMALGARRVELVRLVLVRGLGLVAVGLAVGVGLTVPATNALSAFLYDVSPADPLTLGVIALIFVSVGLLASCVPALRASRAEPAVTLRLE